MAIRRQVAKRVLSPFTLAVFALEGSAVGRKSHNKRAAPPVSRSADMLVIGFGPPPLNRISHNGTGDFAAGIIIGSVEVIVEAFVINQLFFLSALA